MDVPRYRLEQGEDGEMYGKDEREARVGDEECEIGLIISPFGSQGMGCFGLGSRRNDYTAQSQSG